MFLQRIHARLGDLWWYTILMFAAQRFGDAINLFVGLWIVPKFVPQSELGAVMPLTQFAAFVGVPLSVAAIPFMKFLGEYAERGEMGKVKALLRDVFVATVVMALVAMLVAWAAMPFVFERMHVQVGSLGILVVAVSVLGASSNIFQNAVQGLRLFNATVWFGVLSAPLRLALMLVAMPFRPLSGYFVGQAAGPAAMILGALWVLKRRLTPAVRPQPYLREDGRRIFRYTWPIALSVVSTTLFLSVDQLVIRHRLSAFDSAGYYMISRFAEIASYLGGAFVMFLFPLVATRPGKDAASRQVLLHSLLGTVGGGLGVSLLLFLGGSALLGATAQWRVYRCFSFEMVLLAVCNTLTLANGCITTYEMAQGRFRFMWYFLPVCTLKMALLYCVTGYTFFTGVLPQAWLDAVTAFNPNRLDFVLYVFLGTQLALLPCLLLDAFGCRRARR